MIKYIALMRLKDDTPQEKLEEIEGDLKFLGKTIAEVKAWSSGKCIESLYVQAPFTFAVVADFKDAAGYEAYKKHPEHIAFGQRVRPYLQQVVGLYYEAQYLPSLGLIKHIGGVPVPLTPLPPLQF